MMMKEKESQKYVLENNVFQQMEINFVPDADKKEQ